MWRRAIACGLSVLAAACQTASIQSAVTELKPISMQPDDDDGDGVSNYEDRCRLIAAYTVDGCPVSGLASRIDTDFDGIDNAIDRCADQAGIKPHGCPPKVAGAPRTGDDAWVLDRVTAAFPRAFVDVAPASGPIIAFEDAAATQVIDGVYVARFGPYATHDVARVELQRLVERIDRTTPSCCALRADVGPTRARWTVVESEPAFRALVLEAEIDRSDGHDVVLRVGAASSLAQ